MSIVVLSVPQVPSLAFSFNRSLKNELPTAMVKTSSLEAVQGAELNSSLFSLDSRELLFDLLWVPGRPFARLLCLINSELIHVKCLYLGGGEVTGVSICQKKEKGRMVSPHPPGTIQWLDQRSASFSVLGSYEFLLLLSLLLLPSLLLLLKVHLGAGGTREWK